MNIPDLEKPRGAQMPINHDLEIGKLQGALSAVEIRQDRDQAANEAKFTEINRKLDGQDVKLDRVIEHQQIAAALRADAEKRADKRTNKVAGLTGLITAIVSGVVVAIIEYFIWRHTGVKP